MPSSLTVRSIAAIGCGTSSRAIHSIPLRRLRRMAVTASSSRTSDVTPRVRDLPIGEGGVDPRDCRLHHQRVRVDQRRLIRTHPDGPREQVDRDRSLLLRGQRVERRDLRDLVRPGPGSVETDRSDRFVHGGPGSIAMLGERQLGNLGRIGHLSRRRAA